MSSESTSPLLDPGIYRFGGQKPCPGSKRVKCVNGMLYWEYGNGRVIHRPHKLCNGTGFVADPTAEGRERNG